MEKFIIQKGGLLHSTLGAYYQVVCPEKNIVIQTQVQFFIPSQDPNKPSKSEVAAKRAAEAICKAMNELTQKQYELSQDYKRHCIGLKSYDEYKAACSGTAILHSRIGIKAGDFISFSFYGNISEDMLVTFVLSSEDVGGLREGYCLIGLM